jgi:hypothetical protein
MAIGTTTLCYPQPDTRSHPQTTSLTLQLFGYPKIWLLEYLDFLLAGFSSNNPATPVLTPKNLANSTHVGAVRD